MKSKHVLSFVLLTALFFYNPVGAFAGGGENENQNQNKNQNQNEDQNENQNQNQNKNKNNQNTNQSAPFDAGIGLMIGGGIAYALKKATDKRAKDKKISKS